MARGTSLPNHNLDLRWHRVDKECQALKDLCPPKANDHIGRAATALMQLTEYPIADEKHFLGIATAELAIAQKLIAEARAKAKGE